MLLRRLISRTAFAKSVTKTFSKITTTNERTNESRGPFDGRWRRLDGDDRRRRRRELVRRRRHRRRRRSRLFVTRTILQSFFEQTQQATTIIRRAIADERTDEGGVSWTVDVSGGSGGGAGSTSLVAAVATYTRVFFTAALNTQSNDINIQFWPVTMHEVSAALCDRIIENAIHVRAYQ